MAIEEVTIREAQQLVDDWIRTTGVRYFSELTNMAILTEEVGEVARLMCRTYGDQSFREVDKDKKLSDELADVLMGDPLYCQSDRYRSHGSFNKKF